MSTLMLNELLSATWQTIYMVFASNLIATLFGLPIGILLLCTKPNGILPNKTINSIMAAIANATRSVPFIILLIAIIPLTRFIVGTSIGTTAAIVPLTIGAIPFVARIVENAMNEIDPGLIEAGIAMGATPCKLFIRY